MTHHWQRLKDDKTLLGCFASLGSPVTTEILASAGFEFAIIDLEHGVGSEREVMGQLQALAAAGAAGVVRVESHERQRVHRVLDAGAHGVMFPRVNSAAEAQGAISAMRYPPHGVRGVAMVIRASGFGANFGAYAEQSRTGLLTILQIETEEGVAHVDEIAAVEGADVLFVGPMDLTQSLGIFGQFDHPRYVQAVQAACDAARKHGRIPGILLPKPDDFSRYRDMGFRMIVSGSDIGLLSAGARDLVRKLRQARDGSGS